jgi:hypothetical protein
MPTSYFGDGWVALANLKNYVSLYTCGSHQIAGFKQKHPTVKTGNDCINLKPKEQLPLQDLKAVVKHSITSPKSG